MPTAGLHYGPGFPENSLIAFAAALEMGGGIECDLRLTADNRVVVFHDADAWRLCASPLKIGQSRLERARAAARRRASDPNAGEPAGAGGRPRSVADRGEGRS